MTDYEVYDRFFADEEYELENAPSELYSYRSGWNTALKRASIVIRDEIRPQGKWHALNFHTCYCTNCHFDFDIMKCDFMTKMNFCPNCGADMRIDPNSES